MLPCISSPHDGRSVPLQDGLPDGKSFYFRINGIPIFIKGANMIPLDVFSDRVSDGRIHQVSPRQVSLPTLRSRCYAMSKAIPTQSAPSFHPCSWLLASYTFGASCAPQLLADAREASMNMVRVWGGGLYQPDYFYDVCDEMGMVSSQVEECRQALCRRMTLLCPGTKFSTTRFPAHRVDGVAGIHVCMLHVPSR